MNCRALKSAGTSSHAPHRIYATCSLLVTRLTTRRCFHESGTRADHGTSFEASLDGPQTGDVSGESKQRPV